MKKLKTKAPWFFDEWVCDAYSGSVISVIIIAVNEIGGFISLALA